MVAGLLIVTCRYLRDLAARAGHDPEFGGIRALSYLVRGLDDAGATVFLVYAGNLKRELPRRRLGWLLGLIGLYCVAAGSWA